MLKLPGLEGASGHSTLGAERSARTRGVVNGTNLSDSAPATPPALGYYEFEPDKKKVEMTVGQKTMQSAVARWRAKSGERHPGRGHHLLQPAKALFVEFAEPPHEPLPIRPGY